MAFSGGLTLTDLNDFINPSQACIKPVEQFNKPEEAQPGAAATQIQIDSQGGYYEVGQGAGSKKKLETAQISLNDCLACSGCITSAESVLITLQSHEEVLSFLSANPPPSDPLHRIPVLSISPQSLASISASLSPSPSLPSLLARISSLASQLGFFRTYDTTFARHLAHMEQALEFSERVERRARGEGGEGSDERLPMLASACPGWVCYAEKTHGEMLPFMSKVKSPQQVMGTLVKEWLGKKWGKTPEQIYHVGVMPCYDKKLEASRQDFYNEAYSTRDVDCVLTTGELSRLLREQGLDLSAPLPSESLPFESELPVLISHPGSTSGSYLHSLIHSLSASSSTPTTLSSHPVRSSADYVEYTLLPTASAEGTTTKPILRAATCYGFRNLQNLVRKVARDAGVSVTRGAAGRLPGSTARRRLRPGAPAASIEDAGYDFVEVMACPGGCVNGGGQMKPGDVKDEEGFARDWESEGVRVDASGPAPTPSGSSSSRWGDKEWLRRTEEAYWAGAGGLPTPPPSPSLPAAALPTWPSESEQHKLADTLALRVLDELCQPTRGCGGAEDRKWSTSMDEEAEGRRRGMFRTQYRAVESEVVGLAVKW